MQRSITLALGAMWLAFSLAAGASITLFGQPDMRGRALTLDGPAPDLEGSRLNERASSLSVRDGSWQVCTEAQFRGQCVTLGPGEYPTLRGTGLNNRVSSVRPVGMQGGQRGVVLYDGPNFSGRSVRVDEIVDSLGGFNDRARSMIIYDGEWELCEHDRFRGDCTVFRTGQHANLGYLAGELSSIRPLSRFEGPLPGPRPLPTPIPNPNRARAVLYEAPDFRGRSISVDDQIVGNLQGTGFNDRASSLRVEGGYWVFCSDANFEGQCRTFGPGEYSNLPPSLNNRISSGRRIHEAYPYEREPNWARAR